jgi:hypothetical protein
MLPMIDPQYNHVVLTVTQKSIYLHFLKNFRATLLSTNHRSNFRKIQEIRLTPPSDADVLEFITNAFPDLYLDMGSFGPVALLWGEMRGMK